MGEEEKGGKGEKVATAVHAPQAARPEGRGYRVNGKEVGRAAYLKAAAESGWDTVRLVENNYFPSIRTKKHGE